MVCPMYEYCLFTSLVFLKVSSDESCQENKGKEVMSWRQAWVAVAILAMNLYKPTVLQ